MKTYEEWQLQAKQQITAGKNEQRSASVCVADTASAGPAEDVEAVSQRADERVEGPAVELLTSSSTPTKFRRGKSSAQIDSPHPESKPAASRLGEAEADGEGDEDDDDEDDANDADSKRGKRHKGAGGC